MDSVRAVRYGSAQSEPRGPGRQRLAVFRLPDNIAAAASYV
jgi:hypothetical protein